MAFSINKVMLIGNLGKDAETRFTNNNLSITNFTLATENRYKNKEGNWTGTTDWHKITGFSLSDFVKDKLKKGKKFYVEGRISYGSYTDKDNVKRYTTDIIAEKLIPLDSSSEGGQSESEETGISTAPDIQTDPNEDLPF